jgi:hypothetical protein
MELDEAQELKYDRGIARFSNQSFDCRIAKLKRRAERVRKATFAAHCVRSGADDVLQELDDEFELLAGYADYLCYSGFHCRNAAQIFRSEW